MPPTSEQTPPTHPLAHILWGIVFVAVLALAAGLLIRAFSTHPAPVAPEVATEAAANEEEFAPASTQDRGDDEGEWPPGVSLKQYEQLQTGMTVQAAFDLLGEGEEVARSEAYGVIVTYRWQGAGRVNAYAKATFHSGRLTTKSQSGLE